MTVWCKQAKKTNKKHVVFFLNARQNHDRNTNIISLIATDNDNEYRKKMEDFNGPIVEIVFFFNLKTVNYNYSFDHLSG